MNKKNRKVKNLANKQGNSARPLLAPRSSLLASHPGQIIIEVLIALTLLTITLTAIFLVVSGGQSIQTDSGEANRALEIARQGLEIARTTDFASLATTTTSTGAFTRQVGVTSIDATTKQVTVTVSWQTDATRTQNIQFQTLVSNWRGAQGSGGDTGGSGLSGDWHHPRTLGSVDLGAGEQATGLDVINKIVYLTAKASSASKADFFVVDATDGEHPQVVTSTNTGTGLWGVDAAGSYAYVANNSTSAQLQIISIVNPASPSLIKSFQLPGVSGSGAIGNAIFYADNKVYIGTKKATGPEFFVVDVSDPANPAFLGSREMGADVNGIEVVGTLAYVANSDEEELKVLNVANPASIVPYGEFDPAGDSEDGKRVSVVGSKLYLARLVGGNHEDHHEFHIVNIADPAHPVDLGSQDIAADVNGLVVRDYLAFLGTSDTNEEFQVWNISDPADISLWSSFNFPQVVTDLDYEDNLVYAAVRSNDGLRIITSQ
ncbi:MAG: hypothetical protein HY978_02140 [Candidatus Liptonbacteria bacterium]|nr:hypothetical protein [Candidatus Liptonbacteria bacterium]